VVFPIPYDQLTFRRLPWVTLALGAVWTCVFLLTSLDWPAGAWDAAGLLPADPAPGGLALHWLLHESWAHLAAGWVLLLLVGTALEDTWGKLLFGAFFAAAVAWSAGAYLLTTGDSPRPLVGSSAALTAIIAAFAVRFLHSGIRYTVVGWWQRPLSTSFWMPAWGIAAVWFLCEVSMQLAGEGDGVTRGVHYGGQIAAGIFGLGIAMAVRHFDLEQRWLGRHPEGAPHPALEAAVEIREAQGAIPAATVIETAVADHPEDAALVEALCDHAVAGGEPARAVEAFVHLVRSRVAKGEGEVAAALWTRWSGALGTPALDLRTRVRLAEALRAQGEPIAAARQLRDAMAAEGLTPGLALRVVEIARGIHAGIALSAIERALEAPDLHEAKRAKLETTRDELASQRASSPDPELEEAVTVEDRSIEIEPDEDLRRPPPGLAAPPPPDDTQPLGLSPDGSLETTGGDYADLSAGSLAETAPILDPVGSPATRPAPPLASAPITPAAMRCEGETDSIARAKERMLDAGVAAAAELPRFSEAKRVEAIPLEWAEGRIRLQLGSERTAWLDLSTVDAIAAVGIRGLAPRPVVVIDLLLNWTELEEGPLQVVRWRSDRFAPKTLRPEAGSGLGAFRHLLDALLSESGAAGLPDPESARGRPFRVFESVDVYEREVLTLEV
jgi:membrane associated rhomboid family serine protease